MQYGECNWTQIPDQAYKVVVVPIGSLEQHGHHLPLLTDSMIGAEIVRRAEAALGDEAVFLPMLWLGASQHHRRFPGTVSVRNETYTHMLMDVMESLIDSGFKRILILNSHGGNGMPGRSALYEIQMLHRDDRDLWLVLGTWFALAAPQIAAIDALEQKRVTHASELETSMILHLRPELVRMEVAEGANTCFDSDFYRPTAPSSSRLTLCRPLEHLTTTGAFGHPEHSTTEKGEMLFQVAVNEVVACIREIASWGTLEPG